MNQLHTVVVLQHSFIPRLPSLFVAAREIACATTSKLHGKPGDEASLASIIQHIYSGTLVSVNCKGHSETITPPIGIIYKVPADSMYTCKSTSEMRAYS